jgi:hypothetical protein
MEDARKPVLAESRSSMMVVSWLNFSSNRKLLLPKGSLLNRYLYILSADFTNPIHIA